VENLVDLHAAEMVQVGADGQKNQASPCCSE